MKVILACVADHAVADQLGKLSINGIFHRINAHGFPAQHAQMYLVVSLLLEYEDNGRPHSVVIELLDEDGRLQAKLDGALAPATPIPPGERNVANQIIGLQGLTFPKPGRYKFSIRADNAKPFDVPIDVVQLPRPTA